MITTLIEVDLVTSGQIAEMLGVTRQRVHQLSGRDDFPEPVEQIGGYRVWRRQAIEKWAKTWDRTNIGGRPKKPKSR